jgi:hypothetical protein
MALAGNAVIDYKSTHQDAFVEGMCVPQFLNASIHFFSSSEAQECLRSRKVIISGNSYTQQLFVGLADILLSKHLIGDREMIGKDNRSGVVVALENHRLAQHHERDVLFPSVEYHCGRDCYGYSQNAPFGEVSFGCLNLLTSKNNGSTIAVVGAGMHIGKGSVIQEVRKFLDLAIWTLFMLGPGVKGIDSLPAKSVLAGTKLVLFGRYVLKFYVGIVQ